MLGFQASEQATINASPEAIFAIVSDLGSHANLAGSGEVKTVRRVDDLGALGVGATFEADESIKVMGKTTNMVATSKIVEYDPPTLVSWTSMPSVPPIPRRIQWWFRLTPVEGGTDVVHECEVDFGRTNVLWRLPYKAMRGGAVRRGMRKTLDNLRERV
jgi:uncharacterized protein YndB with AHSA1/START domain